MTPLCSIVMSVYNGVDLTKGCLDTILGEPPDVPFQIVVVNDASTDSTPDVLAGYGSKLRVITHDTNRRFATGCNDGAFASQGQYVIFLNNDIVPKKGWLDTLVAYAESHPRAAVVGAKLLYPNDTIQHAGVIFAPPCNPYHIYSGLPADHPAVNRSRRFQVVTWACALVRRPAFEEAGGLDTAWWDSFEDVDLCLRLGELGHEIHYCHESELYHLESVTRGKKSKDSDVELLHSRWLGRTEIDDIKYYLADKQWGGTPDWVYAHMVKRIRTLVSSTLPAGARLAVVSDGDEELLKLGDRRAMHFPQTNDGVHDGRPLDSDAAIAGLEELRRQGAQYLLLPATSGWWLDHYADFCEYLEGSYTRLPIMDSACRIFALTAD